MSLVLIRKEDAIEAFRKTMDKWYSSGFDPEVDWEEVYKSKLSQVCKEHSTRTN